MKKFGLAAVVLTVAVFGTQAQANVRYEFIDTSYVITPFNSNIVVTDAAFTAQTPISFNQILPGGTAVSAVPGLISLSIGVGGNNETFAPGLNFMGTVSGTLVPHPTTIDVSFLYLGVSDEARAGNTQVVFGGDAPNCSISGPRTCSATGYWEVPEPASAGLIIVGFLGVAISRRRVTTAGLRTAGSRCC